MAYAHKIKFFFQDKELYAALFDHPPLFYDEFWIKNVSAKELGIDRLPENIQLEKKYRIEDLGIKPFPVTKPEFEFTDKVAEIAWEMGTKIAFGDTLS